jgi:hypothetical protein
MYRLDSGIKVIPYKELKENVSNTLINLFLESYHEEKLNLESRLYLESKS